MTLLEDCFEGKWLQNRLRVDQTQFSSGEMSCKSLNHFCQSISRDTNVEVSVFVWTSYRNFDTDKDDNMPSIY